MRWFVAIVIGWLLVIALVLWLSDKPIDLPMVIDAQSPGVWPTYAAQPASMIVCNPVLVPDTHHSRKVQRV